MSDYRVVTYFVLLLCNLGRDNFKKLRGVDDVEGEL